MDLDEKTTCFGDLPLITEKPKSKRLAGYPPVSADLAQKFKQKRAGHRAKEGNLIS